MSSIYNIYYYFLEYWYPKEEKKLLLITPGDLLKVNLTPVKHSTLAPARNMLPVSKKFIDSNLVSLGGITLADILGVKLKQTTVNPKKQTWEQAHPVLKELKKKVEIVY